VLAGSPTVPVPGMPYGCHAQALADHALVVLVEPPRPCGLAGEGTWGGRASAVVHARGVAAGIPHAEGVILYPYLTPRRPPEPAPARGAGLAGRGRHDGRVGARAGLARVAGDYPGGQGG
jgi:hypothetical protein